MFCSLLSVAWCRVVVSMSTDPCVTGGISNWRLLSGFQPCGPVLTDPLFQWKTLLSRVSVKEAGCILQWCTKVPNADADMLALVRGALSGWRKPLLTNHSKVEKPCLL